MDWFATTQARMRTLPITTTHLLLTAAVGAALIAITFVATHRPAVPFNSATPTRHAPVATAAPKPGYAPSELSGEDLGLYALIFEAEDKNDAGRSNALMAQLSNRELIGYALAERFLNTGYKPTAEELKQWLDSYGDHPQAARIAGLAKRRGVEVARVETEQPLRGEGYTDHLGRSTMPDRWFSALGLWRDGNYKAAGKIFTKLSDDDELSDWQHAAAHYWAYRAESKLGHSSKAHTHLQEAAAYGTTFYGLLAGAQLGEFRIDAEAPEVSDALRNDKRAIRASLLTELGRLDEAETELRALYSAASEADRRGIVTLVSTLDMPNLQMRLARTPGLSSSEALYANYPTPYYMVNLHGVMDSALLMAVARNESGFREIARSHAGATGMMQMLPSTAKMVERQVGHERLQLASASANLSSIAKRLNDASTSARYGAEYLNILANLPAINQNLIHLLVGYNAGPGTVISWKAASRNITDPLLYIESIPYAETRNYVMQVSAQYWIYQLMMEEKPLSLITLAKGEWPTLVRNPT